MPDAARPTVGFVGLGRMGAPMCRRLLDAGFPLLVFNRTVSKAAPLAELGARVAPNLAELARESDIVFTCLDTLDAVESVHLGVDGLVARARAGTLLVDHSTIAPALAMRIADEASARGMSFLDAPVSGGPEGAAAGTLAIMVGGNADAFARVRPVISAYGQIIQHMGPAGSGTKAKLVNQLLTFVNGSVAAEALALAARLDLDLAALASVLRASFGHSRMLDRTLDRVSARRWDAGAALSLYAKDLDIIALVSGEQGISLPMADAAGELLARAIDKGLGDKDIASLRLLYE